MITPRRNITNALTGGPCQWVPYQELWATPAHVADVLGRPPENETLQLAPADYIEFTKATGQCAVYFNALWKAGRVYRPDPRGVPQYVDGCVRRVEDFDRIEPFDIDFAVERLQLLVEHAHANDIAVFTFFATPFRLTLFAMGYEAFFLTLFDRPEVVVELMDRFYEPASRYLDAMLEQPVDGFIHAASICAGSGPLISQAMLRRYWLEPTVRFLQPVLDRDIPIINHVDGDFSSIADLLLEFPASAIHPFEVTGNLDIYEFKRRYGDRVTVWGNIDLSGVLTRGTPDQVRRDVREHIERLAPGGRYILGSSHEIQADVPFENFRALYQAAREFGRVY